MLAISFWKAHTSLMTATSTTVTRCAFTHPDYKNQRCPERPVAKIQELPAFTGMVRNACEYHRNVLVGSATWRIVY